MNREIKILGIVFLSILFFVLVNYSLAQSLTLSLGSGQGQVGDIVNLNLSLSGTGSATGLNLDIQYNTNVLENPTASRGASLISANKDLATSIPSAGVLRLVASGVNQNAIPNGQVAIVSFQIKSNAPLGVSQITLANLAATDANAQTIAISGNNGSIEVVTTADTTPPTVTITSPTSGSSYTTDQSTVSLAGTTSDNVGVTAVTWSCDVCGSGTANGTTNWTIANVTLQTGNNVITVTAKDAANNTGTDTLTITYSPPSGAYTKEFGSATNTNYPGTCQDTYININATNYSTKTQLNTYTWPANKIANAIVLKWNLSAIPSNASIQSATLYLYMNSQGGDSFYDLSIHKIINHNPVISACTGYTYDGTNGWTVYSGLYNNIPLAQADIGSAEDSQSINKTLEYKSWTTTNMVQGWVSNASSNYGMLLNSDPVATTDSYRYFASTESANTNQRPKLIVTYTAGELETLSVSLSANPNSGTAPLNGVDLTTTVSGTATGLINYTFYCHRTDSGTNITTPYDYKVDNTNTNPLIAVDVCNYSSAGTYTAKVITERGALAAEDRATITVSAAPPVNYDPIGTLDGASESLISGWAYDQDAGTSPINVHIYIDGNPTANIVANQSRPDLVEAGVTPDPNHGFSWSPTGLSAGQHTVNVYAINQPEGTNPELTGSPKTLTISQKEPYIIFQDSLLPGSSIFSSDPMVVSNENPYQGTASLKITGRGSWDNCRIQNLSLDITLLDWQNSYLEFAINSPISLGYVAVNLWGDGTKAPEQNFSLSGSGNYEIIRINMTDFASTQAGFGNSLTQFMIGANWGSSIIYLDEVKIVEPAVSDTTPPPDTRPPTISSVSASAITANSANISWTTNEPADSQVEYGLTTSYGHSTPLDTNLITSHTITLSNLSSKTTYHYRVKSTDQTSNTSISTNKTLTTLGSPDTTPPAKVTDLSTSNISQTSIDLSWTAPGDDGTEGMAAAYDIRYATSPMTEANWDSSTQVTGEPTPKLAGTDQYVTIGLSPATTYYFALKTADEVPNWSELSNIVSVTTLAEEEPVPTPTPTPTPTPGGGGGGGGGAYTDTTPPAQPTDFQATSADKQITLTWTNPTDTDFVRVKILRKAGSAPSSYNDATALVVYEGDKEEYTDVNLDNDTLYYYAIFAYDKKPNYSSILTLSAQPAAGKTSISFPKKEEPTPSALPYPNSSLLKDPNSDKIYFIVNNQKRWIANPAVFISYGLSPNTEITVSQAELDQYELGPEINASSLPEGNLIRVVNDYKVYIIKPPYKRHIFNPAIFNMYGHLRWENIQEVERDVLTSYITSDLYRAVGDYRIYSLEEVDEVQGIAIKHHLNMTAEQFTNQGYKWNQIFIVNPEERDYYQTGSDLLGE